MDEWEEYNKRRNEYLLNRKPERYKLIDMGYGFVIADQLKAKYHYYGEKYEYQYFPEFSNERDTEREDSRFYNIRDLVDELNYLDFEVNGNLYDNNYYILSNKERLYRELCNKIDNILNNLVTNDKFKIKLCDLTEAKPENITINVEVSREGLEDIGKPSLLFDNTMFMLFINIINNYLDEVENSTDRDDMIREDTLIELKMRLLEKLNE